MLWFTHYLSGRDFNVGRSFIFVVLVENSNPASDSNLELYIKLLEG